MVLGGAGLLFARTASISAPLLLLMFLLWMSLRVPALVTAPQVEVNWLAVGEVAALAAGAWLVLEEPSSARPGPMLRVTAGERGRRIARTLFAFALVAFGLSHFFYNPQTAAMVPAWLPFR